MSNAELNNTSSTSSQPPHQPPPVPVNRPTHQYYMDERFHCNTESSEDDINYENGDTTLVYDRNVNRMSNTRCRQTCYNTYQCKKHDETTEINTKHKNCNKLYKIHKDKCVNCLHALKMAGKYNKTNAVFYPTSCYHKMSTRKNSATENNNNNNNERIVHHTYSDTNLIKAGCLNDVQNEISLLLQNTNVQCVGAEIGKYIKPKLSSSLLMKKAIDEKCSEPALDKLLKKLKKCEINYKDVATDENSQLSNNLKSFNYTDINRNIAKSVSNTNQILDDVCALELHRSKTYIIDLIDKALSKELGTIPQKNLNKFNNNDANNQYREKPINYANFSMEITAKLTDSMISSENNEKKTDDNVELNYNGSDEPIYIKHLKELRWTHIRQIQKELKKLEELDHFLNSYQSE